MEKQRVKIEFPVIKVVIGGKETVILQPITVTATDAKQIRQAIKGRIPRDHIFWDMKKAMIAQLGHGVNIELGDGTVVAVPLDHKHGWQFDIAISTSMINKASGQHVPVTYANFVHNALYKLKHDDASRVSQKAKATLIELGYTKKGYLNEITPKGATVLERLSKVDPAADPSCRMKLTRAIFCRNNPTLPAFDWAKDNGFIEYVSEDAMPRQPWYVFDHLYSGNPRGACWYPTEIGTAWLEENAKKIIRHHSCSATRKVEMIPFMPLGHLNEYLSHPDKDIRDLAERRLRIVQPHKRR